MKTYKNVAALLLLAIMTMAFAGPTKVKFFVSDWTNAQNKAKVEKKLYFVDFDASYCAACRNMDASTYQDPALATYMEGSVVALRLDVQDFEGTMWSQKYEIEALPTMLIFNEDGKLVKRLVGYKSAKDLIAAFQEASIKKDHPVATDLKTAPVAVATNSSIKTNTPQPIAEDKKPVLRPVTSKTNNAIADAETARGKAALTGMGLYELNIKKINSNGYTVQLGVYNSYDIMLDQADKLSEKMPNQKILIHVDEMGGQRVFKLLSGNFNDKIQASEHRETLRKSGFDGILKDLSVMK